jgi:thiamine biosynthesis lipoprotein
VLADAGGTPLELSSLRGRVVLLDIFASWCEPCREAMAFYAELLAQHPGEGVDLVAVSVDENADALRRFLSRVRVPGRVLHDPSATAAQALGVTALPTLLVLDREGRIRLRHPSFQAGDGPHLSAAIRKLASEGAKDRGGGSDAGEAAGPVTRTRELMHTRVAISVAAAGPTPELDDAFREAFAVFERVDEAMNEWRPGSQLSKVNAGAGGTPVSVPSDLCEVIELALDGARRTKGLFDPSWAALRDTWRFGGPGGDRVPSAAEVADACTRVSFGDVEVQRSGESCAVRLKRKGMKLGLGGIAKGWGVDKAVAALRARGFHDCYVQAGGDLYASGRNGTRPWRVGIRDPRGAQSQIFATLEVSDAAFSTSGDYEHFFLKDGVRYHHIIDPRGCRPATASRSATVLARSATDAEVLTKAVFILGGDAGLTLADRFGAAAVVVDEKGGIHSSKSLDGRLRLVTEPPSGQRLDSR